MFITIACENPHGKVSRTHFWQHYRELTCTRLKVPIRRTFVACFFHLWTRCVNITRQCCPHSVCVTLPGNSPPPSHALSIVSSTTTLVYWLMVVCYIYFGKTPLYWKKIETQKHVMYAEDGPHCSSFFSSDDSRSPWWKKIAKVISVEKQVVRTRATTKIGARRRKMLQAKFIVFFP